MADKQYDPRVESRSRGEIRASGETMAKKKRLPKQLAILDEDLCTGCDACVSVCPVDCIDKISDPKTPGYAMGICTIDLPVCIGCKLCAQVCPWHVITMVPTDQVLREPKYAELLTV